MASFLNETGLSTLWSKIKTLVATKQDALPSGTAGQVLSLDSNLAPTWTNPAGGSPPEVYIGSDTPSGYTLYIDPGSGGFVDGNEVEY